MRAGFDAAAADHYATLGLDRRCTAAQIRSAYRLLSKRHHPDVNGNSAESIEQSQALNAAYEILSDPARRRSYDRELSDHESEPPAPRVKYERNMTHELRLRLEDFVRGTSLEVRVNDPGNPSGPEVYAVTIEPDTAPGTRLRIPRSEPFADGFVLMRLKAAPHFRFKPRGSDLRCELRISAQRAASGGSEMVPDVTGRPLHVTIPEGVARGEILRIPREGLPKPRGGRGDLLVKITYRPEVRVTRR